MLTQVFNLYSERADFFMLLTLEHLQISAISILLATVIGLCIGIFISCYQSFSPLILGCIGFIYTIPAISLLGFLIPLAGIGNTAAIIALTVYALLPMVRNTYTGITNIDTEVLEAGTSMGSTQWQLLYKIKLPLALPFIMAGFRNMVVMTIALAGIASFIGAGGLGVAIYRGITTNNTVMTVAGSLGVALLALALDLIIGVVERSVAKQTTRWLLPVGGAALILLLLVGRPLLAQPDGGVIKIAAKPMTEQLILTEMIGLLIEETSDLKVEISKGIGGGTSNIHPAMLKGDYDLYPEYTGTAWSFVLKQQDIPPHDALYPQLIEQYGQQYNFKWLSLYGFNNTYGLALRTEIANQYNIQTYSDLAAIAPQLTFGAEYDFFERDDGYSALCKAYGLQFKKSTDLDIGLKYNAINTQQIDVMTVFTTDGQLTDSNIVVLTDNRNFFENYYCGTVIRQEVLNKHPQLQPILLQMENLISDAEMSKLNFAVESQGQHERQVARQFLYQKGLLKQP